MNVGLFLFIYDCNIYIYVLTLLLMRILYLDAVSFQVIYAELGTLATFKREPKNLPLERRVSCVVNKMKAKVQCDPMMLLS